MKTQTELKREFQKKYGIDFLSLLDRYIDIKKVNNLCSLIDVSKACFDVVPDHIDRFIFDFMYLATIVKGKVNSEKCIDIYNVEVYSYPICPKLSNKSGIDSMKYIVSKDNLIPALKAIYIDNGMFIGSDGHLLCMLPIYNLKKNIDFMVDCHYKEMLKTDISYTIEKAREYIGTDVNGKLFDIKLGLFIDEKYVDYKNVIPNKYTYSKVNIDLHMFMHHIYFCKLLRENLDIKYVGVNLVYCQEVDKNVMVDPELLYKALSFIHSNGGKDISINFDGKLFEIKSDNDIKAIIIPLDSPRISLKTNVTLEKL